ncbi:MAG: acetyl-CoA synthase subunit gamma [Firmicutes bacterium]|nr:acetyl-CoA synthase subunit gamma [Bacillota bacterium]
MITQPDGESSGGITPGEISIVSTSLSNSDIIGSWKARWGINRMNYKVAPGLYGVGRPDESSPVLVSANYKMSFDRLRKELSGIDAWILVIDTKGINVWCAAGKGTFGTDEVVRMAALTNLSERVSHRKLILPQMGAPGVAAHEVLKRSGFKVIYGPVKASDLPRFLQEGMKATPEMRTVRFPLLDRLVLVPIELMQVVKPVLGVAAALFILQLLGIWSVTLAGTIPYIGAVLVGCVLVPILLPWIPGRAFAWKGWLLGLVWAAAVIWYNNQSPSLSFGWNSVLVYLLILPAISSFLAMNFTGASTYTSLSGVKREMRIAVPGIIVSAGLGLVLMALNQSVF